ncbi:MAG: TonB-dependent receptor [Bryobacteraceae bacterium]
MKQFFTATILLFLCTAILFGQGAALGTISGRVTDPSDSPIPGATITVTNLMTGAKYTAGTTADGFYNVRFLQPGDYKVEVVHQGFQKAIQPLVTVVAASNPTVNLKLALGSVSETVTVSDKVSLVEFENADRAGEIDLARTLYTPTVQRVVMSILPSAPGVVVSGGDRGMTPSGNAGASGFMLNGGQDRTNEMILDGVPNRTSYDGHMFGVIPTQESTAEVKVITNAYSAEYGNTTGGIINVTTKSGSNEYHGELYTFFRNTSLNANHFERNRAGQPRTRLVYNTYGGIITGRIFRDKLFGTFKYNQNRSNDVKSFAGYVPTQKERNGDFTSTFYLKSGVPTQVQIYDPFSTVQDPVTKKYSRTPVSGNVIPSSRINPVAKAFWKYIPLPNAPSGLVVKATNFISVGESKATKEYNEFMPRIDWNISERTKLMVRHIRTDYKEFPVLYYGTAAEVNGGFPFIRANHNAVVDLTHTLSPTSVLNFRVGMERYVTGQLETPRLQATPADLGFSSTFQSQAAKAFPVFRMGGSNIGGSDLFMGGGLPAGRYVPDQVNNMDLAWSKNLGRHNLKLGGQMRLERIYLSPGGNDAGTFSFGRGDTNGPDPDVQTIGAGDETASFLFGVGGGSLDLNATTNRQMLYGALYVQDDIKITPKLTMNVGLRWDRTGGLTDRYNAMTGSFDPTAASPLAAQVKAAAGAQYCPACANLVGGLTFPGVNGQPRNVYAPGNTDFGPRIAAAYALNDKTAIRAGWGMFYGPIYYDPGQAGFSQSTPWVTYDANRVPLNLLDNPFPTGIIQPVGAKNALATNIGSGISYVDPNTRTPRARQFSFEVQREVFWNMRVSVGYVNNTVNRLPIGKSLNSLTEQQFTQGASYLNTKYANPFAGLVPGYGLNQSTIANSGLIVPYPQFPGGVTLNNTPIGWSRYDALQLYVVKRMTQGISFSLAYTASKKMEKLGYQYATDPFLEKRLSPLDFPQILVPNFAVELPFGKGHWLFPNAPGWADRIINGWQANGIIRIQSGKVIQMAANAIPTGADPNAVPGGQNLNQWINPAAFVAQTNPYQVRRWPLVLSSLREPPIHRFDLGVVKKTRIAERFMFVIEAQATNAMNTPEWYDSLDNSNPTSATFGNIGGVKGLTNYPRQIILSGKILF